MFALLLVAAIAVAPADNPPSSVVTKVVETPVGRMAQLRHQLLIPPPSMRSQEQILVAEYVPYGEELNQVNDWYQRYRADKRWQNGVGITFALGRQQRRWTIGLGPIQFTFGGQPHTIIP